MSYQDFVASTEQNVVILSDKISNTYNELCKHPVKLYKYRQWIICYVPFLNNILLYDERNASWWPMEYRGNLQKIVTKNDEPMLLCNKKLYILNKTDDDYFDDDVGKIDWNFVSQKLHLGAVNYTKCINSFTFASVNDNDNPCTMNLKVKNYRKKVDEGKEELIEYDINVIRTYVKRVNYSKVCEFQYTLCADLDSYEQVPLCFSNICIKYNITGVMR
jgi:hypothetical protein